jgi:hypothetical protein
MKNWSRLFLLALAVLSVTGSVFTPTQAQARDCYCSSYIRECYCTNRLASAKVPATGSCCAEKQADKSATTNALAGLGIVGEPGKFVGQAELHAASTALEPSKDESSNAPAKEVRQHLQQRPPQQDNRYEESTFQIFQVSQYQFSVRTQSGAVTMQGVNLIGNRAELSFHVPTNGDRRADEYHDFVLIRAGERIPAAVRDSWSIGFFTYQNQTWRVIEYVYRDDRQRR